jgi:hypothetical protein
MIELLMYYNISNMVFRDVTPCGLAESSNVSVECDASRFMVGQLRGADKRMHNVQRTDVAVQTFLKELSEYCPKLFRCCLPPHWFQLFRYRQHGSTRQRSGQATVLQAGKSRFRNPIR